MSGTIDLFDDTDGLRYYLAGGAVRDILLGKKPQDFDYAFSGPLSTFIHCYRKARKLGAGDRVTYLVNGIEYVPLYQNDIIADLYRRDFTINALLLDEYGMLHSHPLTFGDLKAGLIRPASPTSIQTDPVRAFRAARFTATFPNFSLHHTCIEQAQALTEKEIAIIAPERVGNELRKSFSTPCPGNMLRSLETLQLLAPLLLRVCHGYLPSATSSLCTDMATAMDRVAQYTSQLPSPLSPQQAEGAVWMALCQALPRVKSVSEYAENLQATGEDLHCAPPSTLHTSPPEKLARIVRFSTRFMQSGHFAWTFLPKARRYKKLSDSEKVQLLCHVFDANKANIFFTCLSALTSDTLLSTTIQTDLVRVKSVRLPAAWQNKGVTSAHKLYKLRTAALQR